MASHSLCIAWFFAVASCASAEQACEGNCEAESPPSLSLLQAGYAMQSKSERSRAIDASEGFMPSPQQFMYGSLPAAYAQSPMALPQQVQIDGLQIPHVPQQLSSQQIPYAQSLQAPYGQSLLGAPFPMQRMPDANPGMLYGALASMQSSIYELQGELATERKKELDLSDAATNKQNQLERQLAAADEEQLQQQLDNATVVNEGLRTELAKVQDEEVKKAKEALDGKAQVSLLQKQLEQSNLVGGRALSAMKDVQVAQDKVRHTEEIIRSLMPNLLPRSPA